VLRKRKPPYARRWLAHQPPGSVRVYTGDKAWDRARKHHQPALVAPSDIPPNTLNWSFLAGRDALVVQHGDCSVEHLQHVAEALVRAGVEPVVVLREPDHQIAVFRHG